jgi:hypothetical protein
MRDRANIKYNAARDRALLAGVDAVIAFAAEQGLRFSCREAAEVTMHKMRTMCVRLPIEARRVSYAWLTARGFETWDDGDLRQ